jgi:hypothetical protein
MDEMFLKLAEAQLAKVEAEQQITEYTNALRALAKVIEDKAIGDSYLARLDELGGKPGFVETVRSILRLAVKPLAPPEIKTLIQLGKKMDLTAYSNPLASIHTTLRRMKDSGEVEESVNDKGEKKYRLKAGRGAITRPPESSIPVRRIKPI